MKVTAAATELMLATGLTCWCDSAQAYRLFDGTDAVADTGKDRVCCRGSPPRHDPEVSNSGEVGRAWVLRGCRSDIGGLQTGSWWS